MATEEQDAIEYGDVHEPLVCGLFIDGLPLCPRCWNQGVTEDEEVKRMLALQGKPDLSPVRRHGQG